MQARTTMTLLQVVVGDFDGAALQPAHPFRTNGSSPRSPALRAVGAAIEADASKLASTANAAGRRGVGICARR